MPDKLKNFSATPANNNSAPPNGAPEGMAPSSVNNVIRENMSRLREWYRDAQWIDLGNTITSFTSTTFVLTGDQSAYYKADQVVRIDGTSLAVITGVVVATNTTVTVAGYTILALPTQIEYGIVTNSLAKIGFGTGSVKVNGSGNVTIAGASTVAITGTTTVGGNTVLTTANAGAGNGLDADTLDGQQGSYYLDGANFTGAINATTLNGQTAANIVPPGMIMAYGTSAAAPTGWLKCNGQAVSRTTYSALFAIVATTFGNGDGSTTFNLPDLRGEFLRGFDDARGIDTGRVFGSFQNWATLHVDRYEMGTVKPSGSGIITVPTDGTPGDWLTTGRNDGGNRFWRLYTNGEDDNRPRNIAVNYLIKT